MTIPFHPFGYEDGQEIGIAGHTNTYRHNREQLWKIFEGPRTSDVRFQLDEKGQLHAMIAYEEWIQFPGKNWEVMQLANGKLMAAAPDLLEACTAARTYILDHGDDATMAPIIQQLEAAIAKAQGGAQ
jgi:hypothetical protein